MIEKFSLDRLQPSTEISSFDCGNEDLNNFLVEDSKKHLSQLLAVTYLLRDADDVIAYFSVLNDSIIKQENVSNSRWKNRVLKYMPADKRGYKGHPAVKVGRLAVCREYQSQGIGAEIMDYIKGYFLDNNKTGCRFITVDAENNSRTTKYYLENDFDYLTEADKDEERRLMFFDLIRYAPYMTTDL